MAKRKRRRNRRPRPASSETMNAFANAVPLGEYRRFEPNSLPQGIPTPGRAWQAVVIAASTISSSAVPGLPGNMSPDGPLYLWRGFRPSSGSSLPRKVDEAIFFRGQDGTAWQLHSKESPDHHRHIMSSSGLGGLIEDYDLPSASAGTVSEYRADGASLSFEGPLSPFGTSSNSV